MRDPVRTQCGVALFGTASGKASKSSSATRSVLAIQLVWHPVPDRTEPILGTHFAEEMYCLR